MHFTHNWMKTLAGASGTKPRSTCPSWLILIQQLIMANFVKNNKSKIWINAKLHEMLRRQAHTRTPLEKLGRTVTLCFRTLGFYFHCSKSLNFVSFSLSSFLCTRLSLRIPSPFIKQKNEVPIFDSVWMQDKCKSHQDNGHRPHLRQIHTPSYVGKGCAKTAWCLCHVCTTFLPYQWGELEDGSHLLRMVAQKNKRILGCWWLGSLHNNKLPPFRPTTEYNSWLTQRPIGMVSASHPGSSLCLHSALRASNPLP